EGGHAAQDGFASREAFEAFVNQAFGGGLGGGRRAREGFAAPGADMSYTLSVSFLDAAAGAVRTIMLPDGKGLKVTIPEGATDGQTLRLKGQGGPGYDGGPPGDAYVALRIEPHAFFRRRDDDIHVELPVTLHEAVLGARIAAPTIAGPVTLTVPKGANTGTVLRLRERGVRNRKTGQRGHQFVTLKVVLPTAPEPALAAFLETWRPTTPQDPRREMLK
ncbi:MAG: molecular chaperone DnaJ, partial [Alphaproteobacteria bacterium HGW-Alphaproteobacteria-10]